MKIEKVIVMLLVVVLCGCATSRRATKHGHWQTAQANNCVATIVLDSIQYTIGCGMQVIRDSLIIISVKPMANIEIGRFEITKKDITLIDKMNRQYTWHDLTKTTAIVPKLRWYDLQTFASGEKKQKGDKAALAYSYLGHTLRLEITYGDLVYDSPINVRRLNTDKYKYIKTFILDK